ncbi:hypothetical protein Sango_2818200 [Sesamum angolense]|uniref:Uncharacterized protein n=1 Tax=Sesamum angolense TaxID=2727404 RepID=A0AAE1T6W9_9LAMI|nr:hypothetical protein Sango_2818200 [Sesamum angolense]
MRHEIKLSKKQSPKTNEELKRMSDIPYASAVESILVVQCTKPDAAYALSVTSYSDISFQSDDDGAKSQSNFVFKLNGSVVAWKSSKKTWDVYAILVDRLASTGVVCRLEESRQSRAYDDCILDLCERLSCPGHCHHKPYPVQPEYVVKTVSFKKRIRPLSKHDKSISYVLKDAFTLYKPVAAVIGRIGKEVMTTTVPPPPGRGRRGQDRDSRSRSRSQSWPS